VCHPAPVQIGMTLPSMVAGLDRDDVLGWCRGVDQGPWSTLAVGERIAYPNQELFALIAAAAAVTDRVRLATSVVVLPMHPSIQVAKWAATVDVISGGRLTLGVGVGGRQEDYDAMEAPFGRRHQRLDDKVVEMQHVWSGARPTYGINPVGPAPVQVGGPPLWSGALGPKAVARAAAWAQGIVGFQTDPLSPSVADAVAGAMVAWTDAGHTSAPRMVTTFWYGLGAGAGDRVHNYARRYLGVFGSEMADALAADVTATSADAVLAALENLEAAGYDEVLLVPTTRDLAELDATAELVAGR
jgi:alkanesulfonate monooxygenase SsuD/methylene tetrahydromethanopterin reductase-like flavin-dependent oxidoreductase (luciferase family)